MTWIDDHLSIIHADDTEVINVQRFCIQQPSAELVTLAEKVAVEIPHTTIQGIIAYYHCNKSLSTKQRKCLARYVAKRFYLFEPGEIGRS